MRIVFMGTPEFAVPSLLALAASRHDLVGVFTRPDAVSGRGRALRPPAAKVAALQLGVAVLQPVSLRDPAALDALERFEADILVVAAYGLILPREALLTTPHGAINVHASLLPRWRGAAPVQRAILAGDELTGVSIMRMEEGLDTGPYCAQESTTVGAKTAATLTAELGRLGAQELVANLSGIEAGTIEWVAQDPSLVTYADKVSKDDVAIHPSLGREEAARHVRASMPGAPCRVSVAARGVTLLDAAARDLALEPGSVACTRSGILLGVADGAIEISRLKPDGKPAMEASAWSRGVRDLQDSRWELTS